MANALIALGSNLGDRAATLRAALAGLAQIPRTRLVARSCWLRTNPVGGPVGQEDFLNAAAVLQTSLTPHQLLAELQKVESSLGRQRRERWGARTLDGDLLLYDETVLRSADLEVPHPRMAYRRFVLDPAAEVAGHMVHPESGWTVAALANHLDQADQTLAIAGGPAAASDQLEQRIVSMLGKAPAKVAMAARPVSVTRWQSTSTTSGAPRPKLLLALHAAGGGDRAHWRKMLHLPSTGPVAWIDAQSPNCMEDALAAVAAVWPELGDVND